LHDLNFTVQSVGFETGFNSKTTFNTVFEKFTGLTPSGFQHSNSINNAGVIFFNWIYIVVGANMIK